MFCSVLSIERMSSEPQSKPSNALATSPPLFWTRSKRKSCSWKPTFG